MNIGVLKDIKPDENRVALIPSQAHQLLKQNHTVYVEQDAGKKSNFSDEQYKTNGAIISHKNEILEKCELLLKIKCPLASEYDDYNKNHTLFAYLHLDENISRKNIQTLIQRGFMGIAYEWVEPNKGKYPLLEPMSKITGHLFYQRSIELCTRFKGLLCHHIKCIGNKGANILIIGIGTIGKRILKNALNDKLNIFVVDKHPDTLVDKMKIDPDTIHLIPFNNENPEETKEKIKELMGHLDIIICSAVRRSDLPKTKMEYLIDRQMIKLMKPNSIVCDATACDKDLIETCMSTGYLDHFDVIDNVIHYNPDHLPSLTGQTSTEVLTKATFEYVCLMANHGVKEAIRINEGLRNGVVCYNGKITHQYTANKKAFEFFDITKVLS